MNVIWSSLRAGDMIICPVDHKPEKVLYMTPVKGARIRVVTSRDDHIRFPTERVEKPEPQETRS
jgi:hypothetical protein